jgi:hypothetical protein
MKYFLCLNLFLFFTTVNILASEGQLSKFNHQAHLDGEFKAKNIQCSHCHNFDLDPKSKEIKLNEFAKGSIFKVPVKQICHECHQSSNPEHVNAPQTCFTCHRNMDSINKIKPPNHINLAWKSSHATEARVNSDSCMNCHTTSQCAKCHLQRNNIEMKNHPRNFKFTHSVQARATPQRCDACHTKSYCISCHAGAK